MSDRSRLRLFVLRVLVISLLGTLVGRLWYLQVLAGDDYEQAATNIATRDIVTAPARGQILDDMGRPLAKNEIAMVVTVDRIKLQRQPEDGEPVLRRLSALVNVPYDELKLRVTPCGPGVPHGCWNGSPYQPIPVTDEANTEMAVQILEQRSKYPGVSAEVQAVRRYPLPNGARATHLLGYLRPVSAEDLEQRRGSRDIQVQGNDLVGATGLEAEYDKFLRGKPGLKTVSVDRFGGVTGTLSESDPKPGHDLVTSLDARVQSVLEKSLADAMERSRSIVHRASGRFHEADSAAGVVLDAKTGHIVAMASLPTYNPNVWVGGITQKQLDRLGSKKRHQPILDRSVQGEFAPGSTFKLISTAAVVKHGVANFSSYYDCPGSVLVGDSYKSNFEGAALGRITLHTTLSKSCDTVYYQFAIDNWYNDEELVREGKKPAEITQNMARSFGLGRSTGVDLPSDRPGLIEDRAHKKAFWESFLRENACKGAKTRPKGSYLQRLNEENCVDGWRFRLGDQANFDIGQGTVLTTPLQLAVAYQALASDGKVRSPRIGKAVMTAGGKMVKRIKSPVVGRVPVDQSVLDQIMDALYDVPRNGTGAGAFAGFPLGQIAVGGKTGTADVNNKQPTSWFASFGGPAGEEPQYVVVAMVEQGGTGATTAAPAVRDVWEGIYGLDGKKAALPEGTPPRRLPDIRPDGTVLRPDGGQPTPTPGPGQKGDRGSDTAALPAYSWTRIGRDL